MQFRDFLQGDSPKIIKVEKRVKGPLKIEKDQNRRSLISTWKILQRFQLRLKIFMTKCLQRFSKIEKKEYSRSFWISFQRIQYGNLKQDITKSKLDGYSRTYFSACFSPDGNILASEQRYFQNLIGCQDKRSILNMHIYYIHLIQIFQSFLFLFSFDILLKEDNKKEN
ncbi:unnamed protein product [Paramecium sonneborni]|uniref:Transmembrane protein n=1 Tax=Paramecium sonneborni TaxID=65129 RepID=A0A8S1MG91_9CILI|nr:unnamed protein product [Paramecium sonneborni]